MGFQPRCREDTPTLELLYVSKQCPTPTPFSPAMTRVRAHQERLIHCLAIPSAIYAPQSRGDFISKPRCRHPEPESWHGASYLLSRRVGSRHLQLIVD